MPDKIPVAIQRYQNECRRLFEVLDRQSQGRDYVCDEYSIADIAHWCWIRIHEWAGIDMTGLDDRLTWESRMAARPACIRGVDVPEPSDFFWLPPTSMSRPRGASCSDESERPQRLIRLFFDQYAC
jgi:GST-like protein